MTQIRTISEAARYFKTCDPNTGLTLTAIRRLITSGTVPSVRIGSKYLVSIDALETFLNSGSPSPSEVNGDYGHIRLIP